MTNKITLAGVILLIAVAAWSLRDMSELLYASQTLAPKAYTTSTDGTGVDLRGYDAATVVLSVGAFTDGTHSFTLEESSDDSSYTTVAAADIVGSTLVLDSTGEMNADYWCGYIGSARYLRVASTISAVTTGAVYGATIIKGHPAYAPTY